MVRASVAAEKAGVRSASVVLEHFMPLARPTARAQGIGNLSLAEYPGIKDLDSEQEFRHKVSTQVVSQIVEGLARPIEVFITAEEPWPRDVVFRGSYDQVQEHFLKNFWCEGLPVGPPTIERVESFLRFTERDPEEIIGTLLPARREATVWNVAVNGVMAGCRPEYMPILLAIVEIMSDPEWRIEDAASTPAWEPLVIVNGPIVKELGFNYEVGTMRVGYQSNTSIGRFARLYMRNVAGLKKSQGETTEKGNLGFTFNVALAENEDAVAELGWAPFGVEQGFAGGENVVTVQSVLYNRLMFVGPELGGAKEIMEHIAREWGQGDVRYWCHTGMSFGKWYPLLLITPPVAKALAREGWTKDRVKHYLYDNCKTTPREAENGPWLRGSGNTLCRLVAQGKLSPEYCTSEDPDRLVPVFRRPEWIGIVVAGDPGMSRARGYVNNHEQGARLSRQVILPARWKEMLREANP